VTTKKKPLRSTKGLLSTSSRDMDKFVVRLPDGMRDQIQAVAKASHSSMNTVMIQAVESYLEGHAELRLTIAALKAQINPQ